MVIGKNMIYAPIIIPTLNRYEHLKRCIESLQKNEWAKYTELYISVDYPPKEVYWEGYKKVKRYLDTGIKGFKKFNLFYQNSNLGPYKNSLFLKKIVFKKYDRFIITEDDNEFSPCFIEYMDKGLEIFESDPNIMLICGHNADKNWNANGGNVLKLSSLQYYYGTGFWYHKWVKLNEGVNIKLFNSIGRNPYYIWKLYYNSRNMLWWYVHRYLCEPYNAMFDENGNLIPIDINNNIFCIIKNKYMIVPVKSMVRNHGRDGSGVNAGTDNGYDPIKIDIDSHNNFEYCIPADFKLNKDNRLIQAGIDGKIKFKDNFKVLQNLVLREALGDKGYHKFLQIQNKYREKKVRRK